MSIVDDDSPRQKSIPRVESLLYYDQPEDHPSMKDTKRSLARDEPISAETPRDHLT